MPTDNPRHMRRILVNLVHTGQIMLDPAESHHIRDVLRLGKGAKVEVFDKSGQSAPAEIADCTAQSVSVQVDQLNEVAQTAFRWTIASALPKGSRVDWMIEKLSELGTAQFIPLIAERSITIPAGQSKRDRWQRLAAESAKQSHRTGLMQIAELTPLSNLLTTFAQSKSAAFVLSTTPPHFAIPEIISPTNNWQLTTNNYFFLIGPEGGWTPNELESFRATHLTPITLGPTILRIETAAVAAATIAAAVLAPAVRSYTIRENP